jgi:amino acid transporter
VSEPAQSGGALRRELGLWDVVMFNVAAILGLRWLSTAAATGPSSITLWVLAFAFFFVPQGLTVIELSTRYPEEGGIYRWTQRAFGNFHGFVAGWLYWTQNLIYFPSLLIFTAASAAFVGGGATAPLGDDPWFVWIVSFASLWVALGLNLVGMRIGKWVQNVGAIGTWIPGVVLIVLGAVALARFGSATPVSAGALVPVVDYGTLAFWATLCFAFAGLELAPLMAEETREPRRTLPLATLISGASITLMYVLGTVALLVALPPREVNIVSGAIQAVETMCRRVGLEGVTGPAAFMITLGSLGGVGAWLAGAARIPYVAGIDRYLPEAMGRLHPRWGTPHVSLLVQGALTSVLLAMALAGSQVQEAYQVLSSMTLIVYFVPYLYLFASLPILRRRERRGADETGGAPGGGIAASDARGGRAVGAAAGGVGAGGAGVIRIPGGAAAAWIVPGLGFATTAFSIGASLVPSQAVESPARFFAKVLGGCALFIGSGALLYLARRPPGKRPRRNSS